LFGEQDGMDPVLWMSAENPDKRTEADKSLMLMMLEVRFCHSLFTLLLLFFWSTLFRFCSAFSTLLYFLSDFDLL
jgi:hypothetical protein